MSLKLPPSQNIFEEFNINAKFYNEQISKMRNSPIVTELLEIENYRIEYLDIVSKFTPFLELVKLEGKDNLNYITFDVRQGIREYLQFLYAITNYNNIVNKFCIKKYKVNERVGFVFHNPPYVITSLEELKNSYK